MDEPAPKPVDPLPIVTPTTETDTVRERARTAWTLGLVAMTLAMVGMCFSYMPFLLAIPVSIFALQQARTALGSPAIDEPGRIYGRTAQITSTIALSFSTFVVVIMVSFITLYFGMFAFIFGAAAIGAGAGGHGHP